MRIALISDVHGNLEALEAVLADIAQVRCDEIRCLGDLVGYGGDPNQCVKRIRETVSVCLIGNHDAVAIGDQSDTDFNRIAQDAIRKTRALLTEESVSFLRSLPFTHESDGLLIAHAHPVEPEAWRYIFIGEPLQDVFCGVTARLVAVGHTHTPGIGDDRERQLVYLGEGRAELDGGARYLLNVGSVGQPRDHDARAAWGLLDLDEQWYESRRVEYDIAAAQRRIVERGLDRSLAERLAWGV